MISFPSNYLHLVILLMSVVMSFLIYREKMGFLNIFEDLQKMRLTFNIEGFISMVTHIYLGNAAKNNNSRNISRIFSIELNYNNPPNGFENPKGCQRLNEATQGKKTFELLTENQEDEDIKRLWSLLCPKEGKKKLNIVLRSEWGLGKEAIRQRRWQAADFLIVDGTIISYDDNYFEYLLSVETAFMKHLGDLPVNFWIASDGNVIEGVGWDHFNYVYNGGLGPNSLIIAFIKKAKNALPSAAATKAYDELVNSAICSKKLSPNYSLIPYYLINDVQSLSSDSFERKEMREWDWYRDNLDFLLPPENGEMRTQPVVSRFEWSGKRLKQDILYRKSPIEYLVLHNSHLRCFSNCSNELKALEVLTKEYMYSNFIVAEDGRAYEAEGWHMLWDEYSQEKNVAFVGFLGNFNSYGPHKNIYLALNSVVEDGLRLGELSKDYKIVSARTFDPESRQIGKVLDEEIKNLDRYAENF